jgi:hypothetical protein
VAARAPALEYQTPGVGILRHQNRGQQECGEDKAGEAHPTILPQVAQAFVFHGLR